MHFCIACTYNFAFLEEIVSRVTRARRMARRALRCPHTLFHLSKPPFHFNRFLKVSAALKIFRVLKAVVKHRVATIRRFAPRPAYCTITLFHSTTTLHPPQRHILLLKRRRIDFSTLNKSSQHLQKVCRSSLQQRSCRT